MTLDLLQSVSKKPLLVSRVNNTMQYLIDLSRSKNSRALEASRETRCADYSERDQRNELKNLVRKVRLERPADIYSEAYRRWEIKYNDTKEDAEHAEMEVQYKYDEIRKMIEEETQRKETKIDQMTTFLQSKMEASQAELQEIKEGEEPKGVLSQN